MSQYFTKGTVAAILGVAAVIAGVFGKSALATFLSDPDTAGNILTAGGLVINLVAGALSGVKAS